MQSSPRVNKSIRRLYSEPEVTHGHITPKAPQLVIYIVIESKISFMVSCAYLMSDNDDYTEPSMYIATTRNTEIMYFSNSKQAIIMC